VVSPKLKHWVTICPIPTGLARGVMVAVLYPKAKALGYYMRRTARSSTWRESPVGMGHIVAMNFSPLAVGMEHIVAMNFGPLAVEMRDIIAMDFSPLAVRRSC
jgi:hypothetical protein